VLQERTFLVGDAVSLADIAVVCAVRGFQDEFASLTAVKRWFATCVNQPAFRCVQPAVASCALSVRAAVCAQFETRGVFASLMRRLPFSTNSAVLQIDAAAGPSALSSATTSPAPDEPNIGELRPIGFACDLKNPSDAPPLETPLATTSPCARARVRGWEREHAGLQESCPPPWRLNTVAPFARPACAHAACSARPTERTQD
jgi:hypothetical protein